MRTIIVLAERALTPHDVERIGGLYGPESFAVVVLVPAGDDRGRVEEAVEDLTLGRLDKVLSTESGLSADEAATAATDSAASLSAAGIAATGQGAPADPVSAVAAAATVNDAEQVLVLTEPHPLEDALHRDWASRLKPLLTIPVLHAIAGTDQIVD